MSTAHPERIPQPKRRRADDPGPLVRPEQTTKRSPDLWFDDGNIVLQAESTQFRVHRSHISIHSTFFNDMFLIPQPEGETLVEGCPLIFLSDTAKEWSDLLMAMYNNFKTNPYHDEYPIDRVLSLLRLGHKYQFDYFRNVAAARLKSQMPRSAREWTSSFTKVTEHGVGKDTREPFTTMKGYEFDLVNTALEIGMQTVLPIAYLLCVHNTTLDDILDGMKRKDGTYSQLSRPAQRTVLSAKSILVHFALKFIVFEPRRQLDLAYRERNLFCDDSEGEGHGACNARNLEANVISLSRQPAKAVGLQTDIDDADNQEPMCGPCADYIESYVEEGRERFWQLLPMAFSLPSDLKDL